MDVHAPIVLDPRLPREWPERLVVDSKEFRINNGLRAGQAWHVFVAVGYAGASPRCWRM